MTVKTNNAQKGGGWFNTSLTERVKKIRKNYPCFPELSEVTPMDDDRPLTEMEARDQELDEHQARVDGSGPVPSGGSVDAEYLCEPVGGQNLDEMMSVADVPCEGSAEDVAAMPRFTQEQLKGYYDDIVTMQIDYLQATSLDDLLKPIIGFGGSIHFQLLFQIPMLDNTRHIGECMAIKTMWERKYGNQD